MQVRAILVLTQDVVAGAQIKWPYKGADIPDNAHSVSQDNHSSQPSQPRQGQLHMTHDDSLPCSHHGGGSQREADGAGGSDFSIQSNFTPRWARR